MIKTLAILFSQVKICAVLYKLILLQPNNPSLKKHTAQYWIVATRPIKPNTKSHHKHWICEWI